MRTRSVEHNFREILNNVSKLSDQISERDLRVTISRLFVSNNLIDSQLQGIKDAPQKGIFVPKEIIDDSDLDLEKVQKLLDKMDKSEKEPEHNESEKETTNNYKREMNK